jgi:hypothetical protein
MCRLCKLTSFEIGRRWYAKRGGQGQWDADVDAWRIAGSERTRAWYRGDVNPLPIPLHPLHQALEEHSAAIMRNHATAKGAQ